jgi:retron-type reverse transcriptase
MLEHKYEYIIKIENLLTTWEKFLRGKRRKKDVILFQAKLGDNLSDIHHSLANGTYKHGPYKVFNISDPKPRKIHKATVRDRVVHHLIHKTLYPYFDKRFIYDSYSCRKEKGVHRALNRLKFFAGKVSKNNSRTCYILKCDIKKFFASVDHETLIKILKRYITDQNIICLIDKIVSSFYTIRNGVGLPLGNLTSQLFANVYMHEFDMFIKQELLVKYYIRYTDDFIILSDSKEYLDDLLPKIEEFLRIKLKLALHENKVYIKTHASGVDFLGWIHFSHHRQIRTSTKRKIIKKLKGYPKPQTIISYRGLLGHGDTYKLQKLLGLDFFSN